MKKNILSAILLCALVAAPFANASKKLGSEATEEERAAWLWNVGGMAIVNGGLHVAGDKFFSGPTQAILHAASILYNGGQIFDQAVARDMGVRILMMGASAKITSTEFVQKVVTPGIPMIGRDIKAGDKMGQFIVGTAIYNMLGTVTDVVGKKTGLSAWLGLQ